MKEMKKKHGSAVGSASSVIDREFMNLKDKIASLESRVKKLERELNYRNPFMEEEEDAFIYIPDNEDEDDDQEVNKTDNLSLALTEKELIVKALERHKGRRKDAAKELGIGERTIYRKIKKYNINL